MFKIRTNCKKFAFFLNETKFNEKLKINDGCLIKNLIKTD